MVMHLPLLFADGRPTSLEKITQEQLERFIPFMLSCCNRNETPIRKPEWWPDTVPFQFPLCTLGRRPQIRTLKEIVCRCYEYYKCEHVLRFCARLSEVPQERLLYQEEASGYVSIYNENNQLIVKFKKKNQTYDKFLSSPHRSLLPRKPQPPNPIPVIEDIYLCNYCDEEFTSAREATGHEAVCKGKANEEVKDTLAIDQASVMRYFGLQPTAEEDHSKISSKRGTSLRLTAKSYSSIPVSSPMGARLAMNVSRLDESDKLEHIDRLEQHCVPKACFESNKSRRPRRICDTPYYSNPRRNQPIWSHTYCFNKKQKKEKRLTWQTGLNQKSRILLKSCRPLTVVLERLPLLDPLAIHAAARLTHWQDLEDRLKKNDVLFLHEEKRLTHIEEDLNGVRKEPAPIIDLCSSSESDDDDNAYYESNKSFMSDNQVQSTNRPFFPKNAPKTSPNIRNLTQTQDSDGPQYGVSARSAVPSLPLLMPATAEEHAQLPSFSTSPNWLNSSPRSSCDCDSVACVCVNNSRQAMISRTPIWI